MAEKRKGFGSTLLFIIGGLLPLTVEKEAENPLPEAWRDAEVF